MNLVMLLSKADNSLTTVLLSRLSVHLSYGFLLLIAIHVYQQTDPFHISGGNDWSLNEDKNYPLILKHYKPSSTVAYTFPHTFLSNPMSAVFGRSPCFTCVQVE